MPGSGTDLAHPDRIGVDGVDGEMGDSAAGSGSVAGNERRLGDLQKIEAGSGCSFAEGDDVAVTDHQHIGALVHIGVSHELDEELGAYSGWIAGHDGEQGTFAGHE